MQICLCLLIERWMIKKLKTKQNDVIKFFFVLVRGIRYWAVGHTQHTLEIRKHVRIVPIASIKPIQNELRKWFETEIRTTTSSQRMRNIQLYVVYNEKWVQRIIIHIALNARSTICSKLSKKKKHQRRALMIEQPCSHVPPCITNEIQQSQTNVSWKYTEFEFIHWISSHTCAPYI